MKIVVVENDELTQKEVNSIIGNLSIEFDGINTENFVKATKELFNIIGDNNEPKIYILDISLEGKISGIDIAKKIRETDWESHIIFITSHDSMYEQTHREIFEVFDFIEKFHNMEKRLTKDLKLILSKKHDNRLFKYSTNSFDIRIYFRNIIYVERDTSERKLIIHTNSGNFKINMTLSQMLSELDQRFKQCHRACIINKDKIVKYDWTNCIFTTDTGETVPLLSKKYKKEVLEHEIA